MIADTPLTAEAAPALSSLVRLAWNAALPKGCNKLVLMCLAYHACKNERAECFPHVETVARLCGIHPRTVSLQLRALALAGLIVVIPRPGRSSVYRLVRTRLAALSSERPTAVHPVEPPTAPQVEHLLEGLPELPERPKSVIPDPVFPALTPAQDLPEDPVIPALPPVIPALTPGVFCTHKGEEGGMKGEGGENVRETSDMPLIDGPSLPTPEDEIFKTLNANRLAHGKRRLVAADVKELAAQALLAGRTLADAARHAGVSGWRWFCADWRGAKAESVPTQPVELTAAAKAEARARAQALYDERLRASIANRHQPSTVVRAPSAAPISVRPASQRPQRPETAPSASSRPISNSVAMGMTGNGWAHAAVARFVAGQPLSRAALTLAADALGLTLSDLKAQRAAATQGAAA